MTREELKKEIDKAKSIKKLNTLRLDVVQAKDREILKAWQDKYWALKRCPTCGKVR